MDATGKASLAPPVIFHSHKKTRTHEAVERASQSSRAAVMSLQEHGSRTPPVLRCFNCSFPRMQNLSIDTRLAVGLLQNRHRHTPHGNEAPPL